MDTTPIVPFYQRFLNSLNHAGADYLVIGGYAVIYHGYVRTTGDLDIWIRMCPSNAERVVHALRQAGFNPPGLDANLFLRPGAVFRFGLPPFKIEILNRIDGVEFDACFNGRVTEPLAGEPVAFINLDDLKTNKRACGRPKDLADLENLPDLKASP